MELLQTVYQFLVGGQGLEILEAALAVLGGLKILARYTPWTWDDSALAVAEKPFKYIAEKLKK